MKKRSIILFSTIYFFKSFCVLATSSIDEYPFYMMNAVNKERESSLDFKDNQIQILHSGIASLQKRIDLIRKAKRSISLEYFIWKKDESGLLIFHELIKKAQEGVKVRIIVDKSMMIIEMDEFFAEAVSKYGIDLRHYQRALDPSSAQFRTHRKILVIDAKEAITGGRNIGNDYFDLNAKHNFLDRDIYIQGKIAKAIEDSFNIFWNDDLVQKAQLLSADNSSHRLFRNRRNADRYSRHRQGSLNRQREEAIKWIEGHSSMNRVAQEVERIARPILMGYPLEVCPEVTFVSDRPGANFLSRIKRNFRRDYKILRKVLFSFIHDKTKKGQEFILASPYFIPNRYWQDSLSYVMREKKIKPLLYTNSLGSTDAFYVAANFYHSINSWKQAGLEPYIHNSFYNKFYPVYSESTKGSDWGMHEKTHIYNNSSFFVGTYNIDNRSDFYNAEMGLFCEGSKSLTRNLKKDMKQRIDDSYYIKGEGWAIDKIGNKVDIYGNATRSELFKMKAITLPSILFKPIM